MSKDPDSPNLFNPMMLWTDLGMRTLEMALSSSQNIGDGMDRLARAGASPEASEVVVVTPSTTDSGQTTALAATPGLSFAAQMQRTTFDLMTQSWQQWMNAFAALASLGAGRSFRETARRNPLLHAMQEGLESASSGEIAITRARTERSSQSPAGRQRARQAGASEHAFAAAEPKRRSRAGRAKPKARSRNS
jgi:hypothetical protein